MWCLYRSDDFFETFDLPRSSSVRIRKKMCFFKNENGVLFYSLQTEPALVFTYQTVSFRIARDVLLDCGAHHILIMIGQVMVNRNVKDENSSKNRKRFDILPFIIIFCKRLSVMSTSFNTDSKI